MKAVTLRDIERIFEILDELGLSREAVVIPLKPQHPGRLQMRPDHRLEIVLDSEVPLEEANEIESDAASRAESDAGGPTTLDLVEMLLKQPGRGFEEIV